MSAHGKCKNIRRPHSSRECTGAGFSETHRIFGAKCYQNAIEGKLRHEFSPCAQKSRGSSLLVLKKNTLFACGLVGPYAPEELLHLRRSKHSI